MRIEDETKSNLAFHLLVALLLFLLMGMCVAWFYQNHAPITVGANRAADRHRKQDGFELSLMSAKNLDDLPQKENGVVIIAHIDTLLHFRIFDGDGGIILDEGEKEFAEFQNKIDQLKENLGDLWDQAELSAEKRADILITVSSITGLTQLEGLRASNQEVLTHYAWINKDEDVLRIPIDRAKEILLEEWGDDAKAGRAKLLARLEKKKAAIAKAAADSDAAPEQADPDE